MGFIAELAHYVPLKGVHDIRRYGVCSSRAQSTWMRCPHLLRLSPLSKAPSPGSEDRTAHSELIERGRVSSTWARLID
jgi:hypothetical protein